ncbi:MAG: ABC transporter ATP-binding protein [Clostridia bacterium]|nr:ABC transporter ATP-binding protein [Clostridia bacterium]
MECICTEGLCRTYSVGGAPVNALKNASFSVKQGEWVTVVGRSGSGKSTLMHLLGCLDAPTAGRYRLMGEEVSRLSSRQLSAVRNRRIGFVFQSFNLLPNLTAEENVQLPLQYRGLSAAEQQRRARQALEQVGLGDRMRHRPRQLSGGQQQRVAIARALAAQPELLLADEPTGNLDTAAGTEVMALLRQFHENGGTVLLITHDPAIAAASPRCLRMQDGVLTE